MTKLPIEDQDRILLSAAVASELKQFTRLRSQFPDLSNDELAHRLAITPKSLNKILKALGE